MAKLGLRLNSKIGALTQYQGYDFESMVMFEGTPVGIDENGIYELFTTDSDNGVPIDAKIELPRNDMGTPRNKRIRSLYLAAQFNDNLLIEAWDDEESYSSYYITPKKPGKQHVAKQNFGRNYHKGVYYTIQLTNTNGCFFALDFIQLIPMVLHRKPGDM